MFSPLPSDSIPWNTSSYPVGIAGGIPETPQFCDVTKAPYSVDPTGEQDCTTGINQALHDCPSGQHVYLPPGRYLVSGSNYIKFPDPVYENAEGKVLKGAGKESVIVDRSSATALISMISDTSWTTANAVALTHHAYKGNRTLNVADANVFKVGQMVYIDQDNDDDEFGTPVTGMPNGQVERLHRQVVKIEAIEGGLIEISPTLAWDFVRSPKLNDFGYLNDNGDNAIKGCGLEGLYLDRSQGHCGISVMVIGSLGCWIRDVTSHKAPSYHFHIQDALFCEFCRLSAIDVQGDIGPNQGGILFYRRVCSSYLYDCFFDRCFPGIEINSGSCANVIAYNYVRRNSGTGGTMQGAAIDSCHGSHTGMNLYEGNVAANIEADGYYGSASRDTVFRNQFHGVNEEGITEGSKCVSLCRWSTHYAVVNNVLGTHGVATVYKVQEVDYPYSDAVIWRLGYPNMGNNGSDGTTIPPEDPMRHPQASDRRVAQSLLAQANYDSVRDAIDGPGTSEEYPSSLYLTKKPTFFGELSWPAIGSDKEGVSFIPAQARFEGMSYPYSGDSAPEPNPPQPEEPWLITPDGESAGWVRRGRTGWSWGS